MTTTSSGYQYGCPLCDMMPPHFGTKKKLEQHCEDKHPEKTWEEIEGLRMGYDDFKGGLKEE